MTTVRYRALYLWFAYLAVPFSGVAIDLYTPSMPAMMHNFMSPRFLVQLTMSLYILGFGFSQPLIGPITDRYGRRIPIFIGACGVISASVLIIFAHSIIEIIVLRLLQGFFVAMFCVPARAIIGDLYTGVIFQKKIANMTLAWGLAPIIAPWVGGHIQHWLGWQANFWFMGLYCFALLLVLIFFMRETHAARPDKHVLQVFKVYADIFKSGAFFSSVIFMGFVCSFFFVFNIIAPFLVQHELKYSAIVYGRLALCMGIAGLCGNLFSRILLRFSFKKVVAVVLSVMLVAAAAFVSLGVLHILNLYALMLPSVVLMFGALCLLPIVASRTLMLFPQYIGMASAALFGGGWVVSSFITYIASHMHVKHLLPLASIDLAAVMCLWLLYVWQSRKQYI